MAARDPTKPGDFKHKRTAKREPYAQRIRNLEDSAAKGGKKPKTNTMVGVALACRRLVEDAVGKTAAENFSKAVRQTDGVGLEDCVAMLMATQTLLSRALKPDKDGNTELTLVDGLYLMTRLTKLTLEVSEAYRLRGGSLPSKISCTYEGARGDMVDAALPNGQRPVDVAAAPTRERGPGGDKLGVK